MNTDYNSWFEKYNGKEIDGVRLSVKISSDKNSFVFTAQNNNGKRYTFSLQAISAIKHNGDALICYLWESEVDKDVMSWVSHASQTMSA